MDSVGDVPQILVHILLQLMTKKQRETQETLAQKRKGDLSTGKEYQSKNLAKYLLGLNDT